MDDMQQNRVLTAIIGFMAALLLGIQILILASPAGYEQVIKF
jgi:hypothetical protein